MSEPSEPKVVRQIIINLRSDGTLNVNWFSCSSLEFMGMMENAKAIYLAQNGPKKDRLT